MSLHPFALESLVSCGKFHRPVSRVSLFVLHSGAYSRDSSRFSRWRSFIYLNHQTPLGQSRVYRSIAHPRYNESFPLVVCISSRKPVLRKSYVRPSSYLDNIHYCASTHIRSLRLKYPILEQYENKEICLALLRRYSVNQYTSQPGARRSCRPASYQAPFTEY